MKIKFIVNPISGKGKQKDIEDSIKENLDSKKYEYSVRFTERRGHAKELCKQAIIDGYEAVIAVGGDGTVNEIASECIGKDTVLGIIPAGSGNGFAYHLGMKKNIKASILQLNNATIKIVDSCTANSMPFVNVSGIGFDAHIAKLFSTRKKRGFINYLMLILKELNYKCQNYHITYDPVDEYPMLFKPNKNIVDGTITSYMIAFANSSQYGNNVKICPTADIKDGILNCVFIKKMPKWKILFVLAKLYTGNIHKSKYVKSIKCKRIKIRTKEPLIHVDGETHITNNNLDIKLLEKSIKILIPYEKK